VRVTAKPPGCQEALQPECDTQATRFEPLPDGDTYGYEQLQLLIGRYQWGAARWPCHDAQQQLHAYRTAYSASAAIMRDADCCHVHSDTIQACHATNVHCNGPAKVPHTKHCNNMISRAELHIRHVMASTSQSSQSTYAENGMVCMIMYPLQCGSSTATLRCIRRSQAHNPPAKTIW
jgi:hypothetical protein